MQVRAKQRGLILAFDPGRTKTGCAIANTITGTARPLVTLAGGFASQLATASILSSKWAPDLLLVGAPGLAAPAAERYCRKFGTALAEVTGKTIEFVDERMSSQAARADRIGGAAGNDAGAACLLARDWLACN